MGRTWGGHAVRLRDDAPNGVDRVERQDCAHCSRAGGRRAGQGAGAEGKAAAAGRVHFFSVAGAAPVKGPQRPVAGNARTRATGSFLSRESSRVSAGLGGGVQDLLQLIVKHLHKQEQQQVDGLAGFSLHSRASAALPTSWRAAAHIQPPCTPSCSPASPARTRRRRRAARWTRRP